MKLNRLAVLLLIAVISFAALQSASADNSHQVVFASAARNGTYNSSTFTNSGWKGAKFFLNITAESGVSLLDFKIQNQDVISGTWFDLPGAALDQKSAITGDDTLIIYPGIAETANESVSDHLGRTWRAVAATTGTGGGYTFSVSVQLLE